MRIRWQRRYLYSLIQAAFRSQGGEWYTPGCWRRVKASRENVSQAALEGDVERLPYTDQVGQP